MSKSTLNPKVDAYLKADDQWREESTKLRKILLGCGLTEEFKWSKPAYTFQGGIIVVVQGFKAYCALLFFKGALLKDPDKILIKTGPNTRVGRQIRFTSVREITAVESALKTYIQQAIEIEKAGLKVEIEKDAGPAYPEELKKKLAADAALKTAFNALTPGRQRAYIYFFAGAKQSATRETRIDKCRPQILKGKGWNE